MIRAGDAGLDSYKEHCIVNSLTRYLILVIAFVSVISANGTNTAAQQSEGDYELGIVAANCERKPTSYPFQGGDCVPAEGTVIVVTTSGGDLIGTCIAAATDLDAPVAGCSILVPFGSTVTVTEDMTTVPPGYAPTNNPQVFDVPTGPPDGAIGGPVFLNLQTANTETTSDDPIDIAPEVRLVSEPNWWIVPRAPGYGNTEEGNLYFGALVENPTSSIMYVGVSFRAYEADGTPFPGCQAPGGEGPGITTTIAPYETAFMTCSRTIVPNTLDGLQVTAQLWDVAPLSQSLQDFEVIEAGFDPALDVSSPMETVYDAFALIRVAGDRDVETSFLFRFYDDQGVQVGTCESNIVTIEPNIEQRVTCDFPLIVDTVSLQPVRMQLDGVIAVPLGTANHDADRTLTIYKAECPAGYVGDASAEECDANPVSGVPFRIGLPFTDAFTDFVATDNEGLVVFDIDDVALDGTLRVIESVPSDTERFVVYCVDESNATLSITYVDYPESSPDIGVVDVAVGTTGNILCDWYNVPEAG